MNGGTEQKSEFLSVRQAAVLLGVHPSTIYQAIAAGRLHPVYLIGKTALRRAQVETYTPRAYRERKKQSRR